MQSCETCVDKYNSRCWQRDTLTKNQFGKLCPHYISQDDIDLVIAITREWEEKFCYDDWEL